MEGSFPLAQALRRGRSQALANASSMDVAVGGGAAHQGFILELAAAAAERAKKLGLKGALDKVGGKAGGQGDILKF